MFEQTIVLSFVTVKGASSMLKFRIANAYTIEKIEFHLLCAYYHRKILFSSFSEMLL